MSVTIRGSGQIVVQLINATGNTLQSTTSATPVSTAITATITPTNTANKILVLWNGRIYNNNNGNAGLFVYRGGSSIQGGYTVYNNSGLIGATQLATVLDSPATTSATTYTIYIAASAGTTSINLNGATDGNWQFTLMEIAYA
jgi:hypothetical protein